MSRTRRYNALGSVSPVIVTGAGNEERAAHVLRRLGFGPTRRSLHRVLRMGIEEYIEEQLHPELIDDSAAERRFHPGPTRDDDGTQWVQRWYTRMVYSRRQLQEKMTLVWHEHFSVNVGKVAVYSLMRDHENLLRAFALGSFRDFLVAVTIDNAMLYFLDNNNNSGQAHDRQGRPLPPNENYARELLQLFTLGPLRLWPDGTPVLDLHGVPVPAYSEHDVKEVARALTGWAAPYLGLEDPTAVVSGPQFIPAGHDPGTKTIFGAKIPAADGADGRQDVQRVIDILMRQPMMAPFIAKELIQKLATETPTPGYVERVAAVFSATNGDLRETVRAIAIDAEFFSPEVMRTQYKTPVEHVVSAARALQSRTRGKLLHTWASRAGQALYSPPSVFSFYRPGQKASLINAGYLIARDQAADAIANGARDLRWNPFRVIGRVRRQPDAAVDALANALLAAPLQADVRSAVVEYVADEVTTEKLRGAAFLIMCAPDFQAN